jgi:hypothetical protein
VALITTGLTKDTHGREGVTTHYEFSYDRDWVQKLVRDQRWSTIALATGCAAAVRTFRADPTVDDATDDPMTSQRDGTA